MNIPQVIKILTMWNAGDWDGDPEELDKAEKLAIEAVKAYQASQQAGWYPPGYKLPGETAE